EHVRQATLELQRLLVQKAMQEKANTVEEHCPDCQGHLRNKTRHLSRGVEAYCGKIRLWRTYGWCPRCEQWVFPADRALVVNDTYSSLRRGQQLTHLKIAATSLTAHGVRNPELHPVRTRRSRIEEKGVKNGKKTGYCVGGEDGAR
ncbi:MAG: hypothetical protein ACYDC1_21870, partial [Limisphaerales bacterium]